MDMEISIIYADRIEISQPEANDCITLLTAKRNPTPVR